ncbi:hypothetical protein [Streptomyces sp. NPDC059762]|uniref:hypothetical protein n=1 Tax=Streptomyces sp. NPDC059762 TaxID=3346938 RepID=UPI00365A4D9A
MTGQNYALQDALAKDVLLLAGSVATTTPEGDVADFSQHGDDVNISAPCTNIPRWCDASFQRHCPDGGGTHTSAALSSATAALIWSLHPGLDREPGSARHVRLCGPLRRLGPGTASSYLGYGIIHPSAHINRGLGKPGAPDCGEIDWDISVDSTIVRTHQHAAERRNTVDRAINRLKQHRTEATRYDKRRFRLPRHSHCGSPHDLAPNMIDENDP